MCRRRCSATSSCAPTPGCTCCVARPVTTSTSPRCPRSWRPGGARHREAFAGSPEVGAPGEGRPYLRSGGAYLIPGGPGAIGLATARSFAATRPDVRLTLLSRSGLPDPGGWDALLAAEPGSAVA